MQVQTKKAKTESFGRIRPTLVIAHPTRDLIFTSDSIYGLAMWDKPKVTNKTYNGAPTIFSEDKEEDICKLFMSHDGNYLYSVHDSGAIYCTNINSKITTFSAYLDCVVTLGEWCTDGKYVFFVCPKSRSFIKRALVNAENTVRVEDDTLEVDFYAPHIRRMKSTGNRMILIIDKGGLVLEMRMWNFLTNTFSCIRDLGPHPPILGFDLSKDNGYCLLKFRDRLEVHGIETDFYSHISIKDVRDTWFHKNTVMFNKYDESLWLWDFIFGECYLIDSDTIKTKYCNDSAKNTVLSYFKGSFSYVNTITRREELMLLLCTRKFQSSSVLHFSYLPRDIFNTIVSYCNSTWSAAK